MSGIIDLDALADALAPRVAARLGLTVKAATEPYSPKSLPEDCQNLSTYSKIAKRISKEHPEAAHKVGRAWLVDRAAWVRFRNSKPAAPILAPGETAESASETAERSGLRLVLEERVG